jgi:hypothetical protein
MTAFLIRDSIDEEFRKVEGEREDFPKHTLLVLHRGTEKEVSVLFKSAVRTIPESVWDKTGLVQSLCLHGLAQHPDGLPLKVGRSWILGRYMELTTGRIPTVKCWICLGVVKPDDWPEGETAEEALARNA